jgi:nucleoside-diphosphate-sugar epimerase
MRVFLTGASGFVGAAVLRQLLQRPTTDVCVLVRQPADAWRIADLLSGTTIVATDMGDAATLGAALRSYGPTHVLHLAWSGVYGRHRNDSSQYLNVHHTLQLLDMALAAGARHVIGLGSQAEYGPCQDRIDEDVPTRPTTMYGAAKLAAGIMAERLCDVSGARFAWLRLFSSYGPGDHPDWMIPYLTRTLLKGGRPEVTAAEQLWDYLYVEDAAAAVVAAACHPSAGGVFNLGSGTAVRLRSIIERIRDEVDPSLPIGFGDVPYRPDQVMHLEANVDRLRRATGWSASTSLDAGLRATVDWYRTHHV